jgi:Fic family protein
MYIHELDDWPRFHWSAEAIAEPLASVRHRQGRLTGHTLGAVLAKARFWERIKDVRLNDRQRLVIKRLLDGFEGKLMSSKYAKLAKCSQDTAHRDILALVERGVLVQNPEGGRNTSYSLASS